MFANKKAIELLTQADALATRQEKTAVLAILENGISKDNRSISAAVVSFREAAAILGYSSVSSVYRLVKRGRLTAYFGGAKQDRATGVFRYSLDKVVSGTADKVSQSRTED